MLYRLRGLAVIALWQATPIVAHEDSTGRIVVHFAGGGGRYERPAAEQWDVRLGAAAGPGRDHGELGFTIGASWMPGARRATPQPGVEPVPIPALPAPGARRPLDADSTLRVRLARDTVVDDIHCAPTGNAYAEFYADSGRLAECPLAGDASVGGHDFPRGTWVILGPDGRLARAWLSRDTRIGDVTCKGTGYKDWITEFHDDGTLAMCFLPESTTIQGVPCRGASIFGEITGGVAVHFHPNGRLASCSLARPTRIDGERHRAWRRIHLDEQGRLRQPTD